MKKRRVIYMTDEDWDRCRAEADRRSMSISQLMRTLMKPTTVIMDLSQKRYDEQPLRAVPKVRK